MISRGEVGGLTLAVLGHVVLFGLLSLSYLASNPPPIPNDPIEVTISDQVGLHSQAPVVSHEPPAALKAPEEGPPVPDTPPPQPAPDPQPATKPAPPKPAPAPDARTAASASKPAASAAPAKPQPRTRRPTGALDGLDIGASDKPSPSKSTAPPAARAGPEVQSALVAELARKLRPFWHSPTGADVDKLKTVVRVELDRGGNIVAIGDCQQKGTVTPSNRPQLDLHCENAKRAIRLAAPFNTFPAQYYDTWKTIFPSFDRNLK
jgi:outer membrane biosynthesis protein TonB